MWNGVAEVIKEKTKKNNGLEIKIQWFIYIANVITALLLQLYSSYASIFDSITCCFIEIGR